MMKAGTFRGGSVSMQCGKFTNSGTVSANGGKVAITTTEGASFTSTSVVESTELITVSGNVICEAGAKFILHVVDGEDLSVTIKQKTEFEGLVFDGSDGHFRATTGGQLHDLQVMGDLDFPSA